MENHSHFKCRSWGKLQSVTLEKCGVSPMGGKPAGRAGGQVQGPVPDDNGATVLVWAPYGKAQFSHSFFCDSTVTYCKHFCKCHNVPPV
jgi:hypothetical protein